MHPEFRQIGHLNDFMYEFLAEFVFRMRLAAEYELHRTLFAGKQLRKPIEITEQQGSAFIGCKAPGKTNGERLRVKNLFRLFELVLGSTLQGQLPAQAFPGKGYQAFP